MWRLAAVVVILALSGCGEPSVGQSRHEVANSTGSSEMLKGEAAFAYSPSFKPVYKIVESGNSTITAEWRADHKDIVRRDCKIMVPNGLTREQLIDNMKHAARVIYDKYHPHAVMVGAYREGTNKDTAFNAGQCILAPGGAWERAEGRLPFEELSIKTEVVEEYFTSLKDRAVSTFKAPDKVDPSSESDADKIKDAAAYQDLQKRFSDAERKRIAHELAVKPERVAAEVKQRYPDDYSLDQAGFEELVKKQRRYEDQLHDKYDARICRKYKITARQLEVISRESDVRHWE